MDADLRRVNGGWEFKADLFAKRVTLTEGRPTVNGDVAPSVCLVCDVTGEVSHEYVNPIGDSLAVAVAYHL